MSIQEEQHNVASSIGSLDGDGAGDHDQTYRFGWRPRASAPYPFNTRQFIRLLVMRSRFRDHLVREGEDVATSWPNVAA
jgi:hypothetical protein